MNQWRWTNVSEDLAPSTATVSGVRRWRERAVSEEGVSGVKRKSRLRGGGEEEERIHTLHITIGNCSKQSTKPISETNQTERFSSGLRASPKDLLPQFSSFSEMSHMLNNIKSYKTLIFMHLVKNWKTPEINKTKLWNKYEDFVEEK